MKAMWLSIVIEPNNGGYLARCPEIQGAFAEGDTVEEAIFNCIDVVKMIVAYRAERGEPIGIQEVDISPETRFSVSIPVGVSDEQAA